MLHNSRGLSHLRGRLGVQGVVDNHTIDDSQGGGSQARSLYVTPLAPPPPPPPRVSRDSGLGAWRQSHPLSFAWRQRHPPFLVYASF